MSKIEEFLRHFPDQSLANLQAAAEDGTLVFKNRCACLLHHVEGDYSLTKWGRSFSETARIAEFEYQTCGMGLQDGLADVRRRQLLLPLIHAEWARRTAEREEAARQEALCAC